LLLRSLETKKERGKGDMAKSKSTLRLISEYEKYRSKTLNLIPSENVLSKEVLEALSSGMAGRYAGRPETYGGSKIFHEIWERCESLARRVFRSRAASVAPISGHVAAMMTLDSICQRGDKIAALSAENGGYKGYNQDYIPDVLGLEALYLPFGGAESPFNVDTERAATLLQREKPKVLVLGATVFLFPHPVKKLAEVVHEYGGKVIYDGSHVLGLVAGGCFQDPLGEGADIMLGSTHKTLFGPQGGLILSNEEELLGRIDDRFLYRFIDNFHLGRVAALAIALEEVRRHGRRYSRRVLENARILGLELDEKGVRVAARQQGVTASHQVLLETADGTKTRDELERSGIIADSRVRLGTNEVTRRGMESKEMEAIASLVAEALNNRANSSKKIKRKVAALVADHKRILFTLSD
jgi:glycine hydroxymethyltransferase